MSEPIPLRLRPGVFRNGTEFQAQGRWRDVNGVRWRHRAMKPIGGWQAYPDIDTTAANPQRVRGAMAWVDNSGNKYLIMGQNAGCTVMESDGVITDLTPGGFTSGTATPTSSNRATTWSWGSFGEIPIGCSVDDGRLWEWDLNTASNLTAVTNAPTSCLGVLVTDERFVFALGAGGDPRRIDWCDRGDRTVWTPASTNQAGSFNLEMEGEIRFGLQMRGEVLIVTSADVWRARYVGYPDVYEFRRIGSAGANPMLGGIRANDTAYWIDDDVIYQYTGGYVQELYCEVSDYFFDDITADWLSAISGWHNSQYSEVWWHYKSSQDSGEDWDDDLTRYISYNYLEKYWSTGICPASTIVEKGTFDTPLGVHFPSTTLLVTNGSFSSDTAWTKGSNWQISGGVASQSAPTASVLSQQLSGMTAGLDYVIVYTIANRTAGGLKVDLDGQDQVTQSANGTFATVHTATTSTPTIQFTGDGTWDGDIDNVSVKRAPVMEHEKGLVRDVKEYAESGPLDLGEGDRRVHITQIYPDEQDAGELSITIKTREYPTDTETSHTAVTAANPTSIRVSGRQFKYRAEPATAATDWRMGEHRLLVVPGGRR